MKKIPVKSIFLFFYFILTGSSVFADHLTAGSLQALDSAGNGRSPAVFNNSEKLGFSYSITNSRSQTGTIQFTFSLSDPNGTVVFRQEGNAVSAGQTGSAGASILGMNVSEFYTVPGNYQLRGTATYSDASESVYTTLNVEIYSPVLNLTYPPDGSRNLSDQPLTLRWTGTGATKYKVIVSEYPSLFNPILTSETMESEFSYPTNISDVRQRLASGRDYYWSVEGLNSSGSKVSEPTSPNSFSIAGSMVQVQSKDLAITNIEESPIPSNVPGKIMIETIIKNQGGRTESNIVVSAFVQGVSQGKQTLGSLNPSEEMKLTFEIVPPAIRAGSGYLVSTLLEGFFDDNLLNNSFTKQIRWLELLKIEENGKKEEKKATEKVMEERRPISEMLSKIIPAELQKKLEGYTLVNIESAGLKENEIRDILSEIESGSVKVLSLRLE